MSGHDGNTHGSASRVVLPGAGETATGQAPPPRVERPTPGTASGMGRRAAPTRGKPRTPPGYELIICFGVVLPLVALGVELATGICADAFFDPVPTPWHALLYASIAGANLVVVRAHRRSRTDRLWLLAFLNGMAVGTSLLFTIQFLPLLPIGLLMILAMGIGVCVLSPVLAFWASLRCRTCSRDLAAGGQVPSPRVFWVGLAFPVLLLGLVSLPDTLAETGVRAAVSGSPRQSARAIRLLRSWGSQEAMLRLCYEPTNTPRDFVRSLLTVADPISVEDARKVFYRVTALPFNAVAPPRLAGSHGWNPRGTSRGMIRDWAFDPDQGGTVVAGRLKGLALETSLMDGSVDPEAALSYLEWTLVFRNDSHTQREARAQIALPPGAVVSRLTLWVNGQEREAAFAARAAAREAYQQVAIQQRRDPVLLTTCGPDRVLMQCFPVPANGGTMKVRLGITAPLVLQERTKGHLLLPCVLERNFGAKNDAPHAIWVESKRALRALGSRLRPEHTSGGIWALRGTVSDADLAAGVCSIECDRRDVPATWTTDPVGTNSLIRQRLVSTVPAAPRRVVFVADASQGVRQALPEITRAIGELPPGTEAAILAASDEPVQIAGPGRLAGGVLSQAQARLRSLPRAGGCDSVPALIRAWDLAAEVSSGAIVWIHGAQPVLLDSPEPLEQRWRRRPEGPRLYSLQVTPGPNRVLEELDGVSVRAPGSGWEAALVPLTRLGTPQQDLGRLIAGWRGSPSLMAARERLSRGPRQPFPGAERTSTHLARLWAYDEVMRRRCSPALGSEKDATALALRYHLVTPVSGAVVLENDQQYRDTGLRPVQPGSVPTIPEPETWALIAVGAAVLLTALRRRQRCAA